MNAHGSCEVCLFAENALIDIEFPLELSLVLRYTLFVCLLVVPPVVKINILAVTFLTVHVLLEHLLP